MKYEDAETQLTLRAASTLSKSEITEYELLQDGEVLKSSENGVFTLTPSEIEPDIPLWMRVKKPVGHTSPVKLSLSTYKKPINILPEPQVKLMDKIEFMLPQDVPLIGGHPFSFDLGYCPVAFKIKGDTVRVGFGLKNTFDPSNDKMFKNLKTKALQHTLEQDVNMYDSTVFGTSYLGADKFKLKIYGFAEGKIAKDKSISSVSGIIVIKASAKYDGSWLFFKFGVPITVNVEIKAALDSEISLKIYPDVKLDGEFELTLPSLTPSIGIGTKHLNASVYGRAENILGIKTENKYFYGALKGELGLSATLFFYHDEWSLLSGRWQYLDGYFGSEDAAAATPSYTANNSLPDFSDSNNYAMVSRDYLKTQSAWLGSIPTRDILTPRTTKMLQESIYQGAQPQIVTADGRTVMVWLADDGSRTAGNQTKLIYSLYNEANGTWSEPAAVWDDGTADFYPQLTANGNDIYVTWVDANAVFDENVTMEQMAAACEISIARLTADENGEAGFTEQKRITNNNVLDIQPNLTFDGGNVYIVWNRNDNSDIAALSGANRIMYAPLNGTETELYSAETPIIALSAGNIGGSVKIACSLDTDADLNTFDDREIYIGGLNGSFAAITQNSVPDASPVFSKLGTEGRLFFLSGGVLNVYDGISVKAYETETPDTNYRIISDGAGITYLMSPVSDGSGSKLYISKYDAASDSWSLAIPLTDTVGYAETPNGIVTSDGGLHIIYTRTDAEITEDDIITKTDLYSVIMHPSHNLAVTGISFGEEAPAPGEILPVTLSVANMGELNEENIKVTVSAEGTADQTFTVAAPLASGGSTDIEINYQLPDNANITEFTFKVMPESDEDFDISDNSKLQTLFYTDLSIELHKLASGNAASVIAIVRNNSYVDTDALFTIRRNTSDGEILAQYNLYDITTGTMQLIQFSDYIIRPFMEGSEALFFSIEATEPEYAVGDNDGFTTVNEIDTATSIPPTVLNVTFADEAVDGADYGITAEIVAGSEITTAETVYRFDNGSVQTAPLTHTEDNLYSGNLYIPEDTQQLTFSVHVVCASGEEYSTDEYTVPVVTGCTVVFNDWNDTVLKTERVEFGKSATAPANPTREGYTFTGWDKDFSNVTSNLTVIAQYSVNQYTITFESNGGSAVTPITQDYGTAVTAPADPTKAGYTFAGWYTDNGTFANAYEFTTMPAQNITLYAKWTAVLYTVTFNANGGTLIPGMTAPTQVPLAESATFTLPEGKDVYTKQNYYFAGWTDGTNTYQPGDTFTMPAHDVTLTAKWNKIFKNVNMKLDSEISLGFIMDIPDWMKTADMQMVFTYDDKEGGNPRPAVTIPIGDAERIMYNGKNCYVFFCPVVAKEMIDNVYGKLVSGETVYVEKTAAKRSVRQYANTWLNNLPSDVYDPTGTLRPLLVALLNYGAASQIQQSYKVYDLANSHESLTDSDKIIPAVDFASYNANGTTTGAPPVTYERPSLMIVSRSKLRFFFSGNFEGVTFKINGVPVQLLDHSSGMKYIESEGIYVVNLDTPVTVTVTKGESTWTLTYGAFDFARLKYEAEEGSSIVKTLQGLYDYYQKAVNYRNAQ